METLTWIVIAMTIVTILLGAYTLILTDMFKSIQKDYDSVCEIILEQENEYEKSQKENNEAVILLNYIHTIIKNKEAKKAIDNYLFKNNTND